MKDLNTYRLNAGLSIQQLADQLGVSRTVLSRVESGSRPPSPAVAKKIADLLGCRVSDLDFLQSEKTNVKQAGHLQDSARMVRGLPKNVPVLGTATGSSLGDFELDTAVVDYVRRPPAIEGRDDIYALYVVGDSMDPAFTSGDLIYLDTLRHARVGDYVVVQIDDGDRREALLKRLDKRTNQTLFLHQFNPPQQIEIEAFKVTAMHRVIPLYELMGI